MSRQNRAVENFLQGKIRKRGCSSSPSSTCSVLREGYRFKRGIVVGKKGGASTPVPAWKFISRSSSPATSALRASPRYAPSQVSGKAVAISATVSARKLAAAFWEMNNIPSPRVAAGVDEEENGKTKTRRKIRKENRVGATATTLKSVHSGSLPPQLSDPSHSPVSERMERSRTDGHQRRASSISKRLGYADCNVRSKDSISNASFMEVENRSLVEIPRRSTVGIKTQLKDVSKALSTSKELIKIIYKMWGQKERPCPSMSLISALNTEVDRARLQVNQLIQEQRADHSEIGYLMKRFAEEKAAWSNKEQKLVEAAIESVAGELEAEKKIRRRFESLNKKIGNELADTKASLKKALKEIDTEKRARTLIEKVCDGLARDISEDKAEVEELKRESLKVREEVEKEREMLQLADALREERVQMKLFDAKHQLEEKNAAVDKLKNQLQAFLRSERLKDKPKAPPSQGSQHELAEYLNDPRFRSYLNEDDNKDGEVEDGEETAEADSSDSELHSIELKRENSNKSYKWAYSTPGVISSTNKAAAFYEDDNKGRKSTSSRSNRKSTYLQRSISDGVDWVLQSEKLQNAEDGLDWGKFRDTQKLAEPKVYGDDAHLSRKSITGLKDHLLSGSRHNLFNGFGSPTREGLPIIPGTVLKSRLSETRGEAQNARKSRW